MSKYPIQHEDAIEMDDRKTMAGTARDAQEMKRLGKDQQLNVRRVRQ